MGIVLLNRVPQFPILQNIISLKSVNTIPFRILPVFVVVWDYKLRLRIFE